MMRPSAQMLYAWPAKAARPRRRARALNSSPKLLYKWQQAAQTPAAAAGANLDPATAAELRQLRAANRRQAQDVEMLKKAIAIFSRTSDQ